MDDLLDPPVTLGADDDPPVPQRDVGAHEAEAVAGSVAEQIGVAARGAEEADDGARPGRGAGLEDERHVDAVALELGREGQRERAAAGEDDVLAGEHALGLDERLRATRRDHAGQRPARERRPGDRARRGRGSRGAR